MMFNFIKKSAFWGGLVAILVAVFISGIYLGYSNRPEVEKVANLLSKKEGAPDAELDFSPFWREWNLIEEKYVSGDGLSRQEMIWGAMAGLVNSLGDPYSVFLPPREAEIFESSVRGDFEGVGMEIGMRDGILTVVAPLKNTPAEKAGVKSGDQIIKIDDALTADLNIDEAVDLIRGERGTEVVLTVLREEVEEPLEISVMRDKIELPVLETEQKEKGIFVIRLYNFSARSHIEFRKALREMVDSRSDKLIVDLRGNTGGYLESSVDIASWFLPVGDVVAREKFGNGEERLYRSKGYGAFDDLPMVVLVNKGSASASEILAGALRDHEIATLVGETTFGKGSVQELISINGNGSLKLTIARWLTPNSDSISEKGLDPDVEVKLTEEDFKAGRDPQMNKAVELLTSSD